MRVVHLSSRERRGGAATAAHRLHVALLAAGVSSRMLVQRRETADPTVRGATGPAGDLPASLRRRLDRLPLRLHRDRDPATFSLNWVPGVSPGTIRSLEPDVVHVHWIGHGFLRLEALARLEVPLVWTLHDMWAFTGGCHYSGGCERFEGSCGACPLLGSERARDLSRWTWRRKRDTYGDVHLTAVAPSRWMAGLAGRSALLGDRRIEVIPNGLDVERFRPVDPGAARDALELPGNRLLVAFGAMEADSNPRKGYPELREALRHVRDRGACGPVDLLTFGGDRQREALLDGLHEHRLGTLRDDRTLVRAYSAADVFVLPSREDNLPNTALEALACGTPVAAFDVGGIPEMVEDGENGVLAPAGDTRALGAAVARLLADPGGRRRMGRRARDRAAREHAAGRQARRLRRLYGELAGA